MAERVWDKYLTEQDKAHLAIRGKREKKVFGSKPALLMIDNYRSVAGDEPMDILDSIKIWPGSMGYAAWEALDNIADLLKVAREAGIPVAHVHGLPEEESGVGSWGSTTPKKMTPEEADRHARRFDFMPQAAPVAGDVVLRKSAPSAFFGTPLMAALNAKGVDTLIVCGESTSGCVRASVIDGKSYRFNMVVVEEGVYDRHEATHALNLFDMDQKYATVLPIAEVKEWIASWKQAQKGELALAAI